MAGCGEMCALPGGDGAGAVGDGAGGVGPSRGRPGSQAGELRKGAGQESEVTWNPCPEAPEAGLCTPPGPRCESELREAGSSLAQARSPLGGSWGS